MRKHTQQRQLSAQKKYITEIHRIMDKCGDFLSAARITGVPTATATTRSNGDGVSLTAYRNGDLKEFAPSTCELLVLGDNWV